jgi:hypothetical protein
MASAAGWEPYGGMACLGFAVGLLLSQVLPLVFQEQNSRLLHLSSCTAAGPQELANLCLPPATGMDRYVRVDTQKAQQQPTEENEVRITAAGKTRNYISYATNLLTQKGHTSVVLKAMGKAINKTVTIGQCLGF